MTIEGSSKSPWRRYDSSRGLSSSGVPDRNLVDASSDSKICKDREEMVITNSDHTKNPVVSSGVRDEVDIVRSSEWGEVSLRQWLDKTERSVDAFECFHIFRQIVSIVNSAHSQGIVVHNVRPSCFIMSSFNNVSFIESASCSDSGSDDGLHSHTAETKDLSSPLTLDMGQQKGRFGHFRTSASAFSGSSQLRPSAVYAARLSLVEESEENRNRDRRNVEQAEEKKQVFPMKQILLMETTWYTSPEELAGSPSSCASDIYRLGVLLFEVCNWVAAYLTLNLQNLNVCFTMCVDILLLLGGSYSAHSVQEKKSAEQ